MLRQFHRFDHFQKFLEATELEKFCIVQCNLNGCLIALYYTQFLESLLLVILKHLTESSEKKNYAIRFFGFYNVDLAAQAFENPVFRLTVTWEKVLLVGRILDSSHPMPRIPTTFSKTSEDSRGLRFRIYLDPELIC